MLWRSLTTAVAGIAIAALPGAGAGAERTAYASDLSPNQLEAIYFDAARAGRTDLVDGLIRRGMKVDLRDSRGYTALILAAYAGQLEIVDFLIHHGADACAVDPKGNSSLMGVAFKGEARV